MLDYRPDRAPDTPGLLTDCIDVVPTERGYRGFTTPVQVTNHSLTHAVNESQITSLFATRWLSTPGGIVIAGTNKDLYVYDYTNGFIKISIAGGYNLTGSIYQYGEDATASFDQCAFGDVLIATHQSTYPQYRNALDRTIATLYANLGTTVAAPKASVCAVASNFVFLGDLSGTWGSAITATGTRDMVAWCGIGDHQNWDITPTSSQGSFQQFVDVPGPITAITPFQDGIIVFKANAMYRGVYVGTGTNSAIWEFERISDRIGCLGHHSVIDIGGQLVFIGSEDVYRYDGSRPESITDGIWATEFKAQTNFGGISPMRLGHDKVNNCVLISRGAASGQWLLWSYRYDKWSVLADGGSTYSGIQPNDFSSGRDIMCRTNVNDFRVVTTTIAGGNVSHDHFDLYTMFATGLGANGVPPTTSKCFFRQTDGQAGFNSDRAFVTTGAIGHDDDVTKFTRVAPKYSGATGTGTTNTCLMESKVNLGDVPWVTNGTVTINARKRFDLMSLGNVAVNWARFTISFTVQGEELMDIGIEPKPSGKK